MEVTPKKLKIQRAAQEITKILERHGLEWREVMWHSNDETAQERQQRIDAWKKLAGLWRGRKGPNPVRWQRTVRKEWDRKLP